MKNWVLGIAISMASISWGQELNVEWSAPFCKIGEPVQLRLKVSNAPDSVVHIPMYGEFSVALSKTPKEKDATGLMEVLGTFHDTTYLQGKQRIWQGYYTVIPWDTGSYFLQNAQVQLPDTLLSASVPRLDVTFRDLAKSRDITELQSSIPADIWLWLRKYWWLLVLALIGGTALYFWRRRKKLQLEKALTLPERTLLQIDALQKEALWKKEEYSLHYVRFSFILRNYLSELYQLNLIERTTNESLLLLKEVGLTVDQLNEIERLMFISDRVKFAQDTPNETTVIEGLVGLKSIVTSLYASIQKEQVANG